MDYIRNLIALGKTEEALEAMSREGIRDAVLLLSRYNGAARQYSMGLIKYDEWSRVQAQLNFAALEMLPKQAVVIVNNNFVYMNFIAEKDKPGNELALFNEVFRSLHKMVDDINYPIDEIEEAVRAFDRHIGMPELLDSFEDFGKTAYKTNTENYKLGKRKEFVQMILKMESELKEAVKQIVQTKQAETGWKEAWNLLLEQPSKNRWDNTRNLIDIRLTEAIFDNEQRVKWAEISTDVNNIAEGMLWKFGFTRMLPDLKRWIAENMH